MYVCAVWWVGGWALCACLHASMRKSPRCLQNDKVDVAGKLPAITESTKILLSPLPPTPHPLSLTPESTSLCLSLSPSSLSHSCSLCLYFSLSIIVFINNYQCWSLLARIIVYFCDILYSVSQAVGNWCVCVCLLHLFIASFSLSLYCIFSLIAISLCLSGWITHIASCSEPAGRGILRL